LELVAAGLKQPREIMMSLRGLKFAWSLVFLRGADALHFESCFKRTKKSYL
jgi:hypothetical protein